VLLGATINKTLDWYDHVAVLERELNKRVGILNRLRNHIPRGAMVGILPGFFNSKATYIIDVTTNPTGREKGSQTTVQKIQLRQNAAMRACLGFKGKIVWAQSNS
jgi:hypothetical protein